MKKIYTSLLLIFIGSALLAQQKDRDHHTTIKWAPTGLFLGDLGLQGEYNFGKNSLTAKIGIPVNTKHTFQFDNKDAYFTMKSISFLAGYRTYLSAKHMRGLYVEPFFKYVQHVSEGSGLAQITGETETMSFTNDYNAIGIGAQLGVQFLVKKRFVIDFFFLGPEINSARNNFKTVELYDIVPWTDLQASEIKSDINNFIGKFPFIRNHTNIMVDQANKIVTANFKGALPGYRIGLSVGYSF